MLRPGGYLHSFGGDLPEQENDTFTCKHCNRVVIVKLRCDPADMGGRCFNCDGLICPRCVGKGCTPFEKRLEQIERRDRLYNDMRG